MLFYLMIVNLSKFLHEDAFALKENKNDNPLLLPCKH